MTQQASHGRFMEVWLEKGAPFFPTSLCWKRDTDAFNDSTGDKMSSTSSAKKNRQNSQQQLLFATSPISNSPALPRAESPQTKPRDIKSPSPHSPLAKNLEAANPGDLIQNLQYQIRKLETVSRRDDIDTVSTGCIALDQLLPEKGLARGTIIELLADGPGNSAATLALIAARNACLQEKEPVSEKRNGQDASHSQSPLFSRTLIVIDPQQLFYPPAAAAWGIDLKNTIVLRPDNVADQNWALQQSLACPAVAAVWAMIDEIDERSFRRFQLAAEQSGCLGLFHRPAHARHQPSWSEIQLGIRPLPSHRGRRLQVQLLKCRGGANGKRIELEINEATGIIRGATGPKISKPVIRNPGKATNTA